MLNWSKEKQKIQTFLSKVSFSHIFKQNPSADLVQLTQLNNFCSFTKEIRVLHWSLFPPTGSNYKCEWVVKCWTELPALQQFWVNRLLSTQRSLFALAGLQSIKRDTFLYRWMAERVGTPTELQASIRVVVRESRRGAWRGVTRRFLILLRWRKRDRCQRVRKLCKTRLMYIYRILYLDGFSDARVIREW